ncbi:hypothetical protein ACJX0J_015216 [Zea mays]
MCLNVNGADEDTDGETAERRAEGDCDRSLENLHFRARIYSWKTFTTTLVYGDNYHNDMVHLEIERERENNKRNILTLQEDPGTLTLQEGSTRRFYLLPPKIFVSKIFWLRNG